MKNLFFLSAVTLTAGMAFIGCTREPETVEEPAATHSIRFIASQLKTKTSMEINGGKAYFSWEDADTENVHIYENDSEATVEASLDETKTFMSFLATFPGAVSPSDAVYKAHLNSDITAQSPGTASYDGRADVLVADMINVTATRSSAVEIKFERGVAVNKMTLKGLGANESVTSVSLTSSRDIAGKYVKDEWTEKSRTIDITPSGVTSDDSGDAVIYFTCLPVTDADLSVNVTTGEGNSAKYYRKQFSKSISFTAGSVKSFGVTVEAYHAIDETGCFYVENISAKQSRFYIQKSGSAPDVTLEYSRDYGVTWQSYSVSSYPYISMGYKEKIYLRGHGNTAFATSNSKYIHFVSTSSEGDVKVGGDIMTLLDAENPPQTLPDFGFFGLFYSFNSVKDASALRLSADTVGISAYSNMFMACNRLVNAPEILATSVGKAAMAYMFGSCSAMTKGPSVIAPLTLPDEACANMFSGASALVEAPEIAAATIGQSTFSNMFYNCKALTKAPSILKATILPKLCYNNMFYRCSSLQTAPVMAEGSVAGESCCNQMFQECISLTGIPSLKYASAGKSAFRRMFYGCKKLTDLSAMTIDVPALGESSCSYMFNYCTELTKTPALSATSVGISSCEYMFSDCPKLTEFTGELKAEVMKGYCYSRMFLDCKELTTVPVIKAVTLDDNCFSYMFSGCTSLSSVPDLNAEKLASNCYTSMFSRCTGIVNPPAIGALKFAASSCSYMFNGCTSLRSIPIFRNDAVMASYCCQGMYAGCTGLVNLPDNALPSTSLASDCYYRMFESCKNINNAPSLPATVLPDECYLLMFDGCTSLLETPDFCGGTVGQSSYASMFRNCTSLTTVKPFVDTARSSTLSANYMFSGCTSLTDFPKIPASFLAAEDAVQNMFYNCTGLEDLSHHVMGCDTTVCHADRMFNGCTNLKYAPGLNGDKNSTYTYMFQGCTSLKDVAIYPMNNTYSEVNCTGMYYNCTSLTDLSGLTLGPVLVESAYREMFYGCKNIVNGPTLSAPELMKDCYRGMFRGCKSLQSITILATDISASYCLSEWMNSVSESGTFCCPASMRTEYPSGSSGIPSGWTVRGF